MDFHRHDHRKADGRQLYLYSREPRDYRVTNDVEGPYAPNPHLRWHPLRREWVAYNASRNTRTLNPPPDFNPLAPVAVDGYPGEIPVTDFEIAVFENRWPGFAQLAVGLGEDDGPPAKGVCKVVVYTTEPSGTLHDLPVDRIALLLQAWADRYRALQAQPEVQYVMPFESRGAHVGVTLPHPHGQIYAFPFLPPQIERQARAQMENQALTRLVHAPDQALVVEDREHTVALCPEYARYPFETWVLPRERVVAPDEMSDAALIDFAHALKRAQQRLDRHFGGTTPLVLWCALPPKGFEGSWPFHVQLWPMQRGENKFKFLASVEQITGVFLVDVLPEDAAATLRAIDPDSAG